MEKQTTERTVNEEVKKLAQELKEYDGSIPLYATRFQGYTLTEKAAEKLSNLNLENATLITERDAWKQLYEAGCKHWNPVYEIILNERDKLRENARKAANFIREYIDEDTGISPLEDALEVLQENVVDDDNSTAHSNVNVKELVWKQVGEKLHWIADPELFHATGHTTGYVVKCYAGTDYFDLYGPGHMGSHNRFGTLEEAREHAQKDYENRIMMSLRNN
jgi:hypothetical protein